MIQSQNVVFIKKKNSIDEINKNQIKSKLMDFHFPLIFEERKVSPLYMHR